MGDAIPLDALGDYPREDAAVVGPLQGAVYSQAADALDRLQTATTWQPMATAPKDGREVLLCVETRASSGKMLVGHYMPGGYCIEDHPSIDEGWYFWSGSRYDRASKPISWIPLPEAAPAEGK